nr:50S ribosomal protein L11 methyltransferase [Schwartzia sp. (in: firmicutes)]
MEWAEVSFRTSHAAQEAVSALFEETGASGTVIEDPALINDYIHSGLW